MPPMSDQDKFDTALRQVATTSELSSAETKLVRMHQKTTVKTIGALSRTSPEYQRHVIERLLAGDKAPYKPRASTLLIYDTVKFEEVTSRLHRALGSVKKEARFLERRLKTGQAPKRLGERLLLLDLIVESASALVDLIDDVDVILDCRSLASNNSSDNKRVPMKDQIYAASALGLVGKNVRNVPCLKKDHLPTSHQKRQAIELAREAAGVAAQIGHATRIEFGNADAACRVRGRTEPVARVITHSKPDGDAIVSAWLAERYLFAGKSVEVLFVDRGRVLGAYRVGDCLVDVGNTHDPKNLFFDHKPPAFPKRDQSCAAKLFWDYLRTRGRRVEHLKDLIRAVFATDAPRMKKVFSVAHGRSQMCGFHAVLKGVQATSSSDADVYRAARTWLDRHYPVEKAVIR